jgi:hypothetical protein
MYHLIEFRLRGLAEWETPGKYQLEQVAIQQGTRVYARIRPYVVETTRGPVEMADLFLQDGNVVRSVRYATFRFVED